MSFLPRRPEWLAPVLCFASLAAILAASAPGTADAKNRYALEPPNVESKPAFKYAALTGAECLKELDARGVPYKLQPPTRQVETPLRFTGPVRGVSFKLTKRAEPNPDATSAAAIADCRLALAIDDFAKILRRRGVTEVEYLSMYRKRGVGFVKPGKRHPSALAIDVATLKTRDDGTFSVYADWHGRVGGKTCGDGASKPTKDTKGARFLREVVCETAEAGSFNLFLTPHYDWGHKDHFHMEVRTGIRWFLIQ